MDLDTINRLLDEAAETLPAELYEKLNGGVVLVPEVKYHPQARQNDLYIMGEYHNNHMMGRYIKIYGGSFLALYGHLDDDAMRARLLSTLKHEFVHHVESLAGDIDLEIEDAKRLSQYRDRWRD